MRYLAILLCTIVLGFVGCTTNVSSTNDFTKENNKTDKIVISNDTVWNDQNNVYYIDTNLVISAHVTWGRKIHVVVDSGINIQINGNGVLTIEEGVEAQFDTNAFINVGIPMEGISPTGTLIAQGSDSLPVVFTHTPANHYWGLRNDYSFSAGLAFFDGAGKSILKNCVIEYANTGIYVVGCKLKITDCIMRYNKRYGIEFDGTGSPLDSLSFLNT